MKLLYVAGPYTAPTAWQVQKNIREAMEIALKYWRLGYAVICPHANSAGFDGELDWQVFMDGDLEMIRRCDVVVMHPRWSESRGASIEHSEAQRLGKEIIYV